ncbi:hypothetical protein Tco_0064480 [Tanacetum coccineum]
MEKVVVTLFFDRSRNLHGIALIGKGYGVKTKGKMAKQQVELETTLDVTELEVGYPGKVKSGDASKECS